jgi:hypothetical protein
MSDILLQRLRSGEQLDMTEEEIIDAVSMTEFVESREGENYLSKLMDEAMQTFIDKMVDSAEISIGLKQDYEAEQGGS